MHRYRSAVVVWVTTYRDRLAMAVGVGLPLAVAALLIPFRATFADAAAALVLIAAVALVAILGTRSAGYLAALSAPLWFDFFLTRPYEQLVITQRSDIEIAISLLAVGVIVTELAARSRHHHGVARQESDHVEAIYEISELVSSGASAHQVVSRVSTELMGLLHLRDCRFETVTTAAIPTRIDHDGRVFIGPNIWPVDQMGIPGSQAELVALGRGHIVGRFVLTPTPGQPVSLQRRLVAVAVVDQVGALLTPRLRSA